MTQFHQFHPCFDVFAVNNIKLMPLQTAGAAVDHELNAAFRAHLREGVFCRFLMDQGREGFEMFLLMFLVISLSCDFLPDFELAYSDSSSQWVFPHAILCRRSTAQCGSRCTSRRPLFRSHSVFSRLICGTNFCSSHVLPESLVPRVAKCQRKYNFRISSSVKQT